MGGFRQQEPTCLSQQCINKLSPREEGGTQTSLHWNGDTSWMAKKRTEPNKNGVVACPMDQEGNPPEHLRNETFSQLFITHNLYITRSATWAAKHLLRTSSDVPVRLWVEWYSQSKIAGDRAFLSVFNVERLGVVELTKCGMVKQGKYVMSTVGKGTYCFHSS